MARSARRLTLAALLVFALCAMATGCAGGSATAGGGSVAVGLTTSSDPALDAGRQLVVAKCDKCHPLRRVELARKDQAAWEETINRMRRRNGLILTDAEMRQILDYLQSR